MTWHCPSLHLSGPTIRSPAGRSRAAPAHPHKARDIPADVTPRDARISENAVTCSPDRSHTGGNLRGWGENVRATLCAQHGRRLPLSRSASAPCVKAHSPCDVLVGVSVRPLTCAAYVTT